MAHIQTPQPIPLVSTLSTQLVNVVYRSDYFSQNSTQIAQCYGWDKNTPTIVRSMCGPQTLTSASGNNFIVIRNYTVRLVV